MRSLLPILLLTFATFAAGQRQTVYSTAPVILPPHPPAGYGYWSASGFHGFATAHPYHPYPGTGGGYHAVSRVPIFPIFPVLLNDDLSLMNGPVETEAGQPTGQASVPEPESATQQPAQAEAQDTLVNPDTPIPAPPPIVVVLKTGQRLLVSSYAVFNGTLWDLSKPVTRKIPIAAIDLNASVQASAQNGVDFPTLGS